MKQIKMLLLASMVMLFTGCNNDGDPIVPPPVVEEEIVITGTLDSTFGTGGIVVDDGIVKDATGKDMVLDGSGNVYVVGFGNYSGGDRDMAIWKYDSSGTPDVTFGTDGIIASELASVGDYGNIYGQSIELDGSGNIYVVGHATNSAGDDDMVIWKYDSTGTLDSTFGTGGIVVDDGIAGGTNGNDFGADIVLDGSGNIYVAGSAANSAGDRDMVILKYDGTGTLDSTFGTDGVVVDSGTAGGMNGNEGADGIALDGSGNIYMSGYSLNGDGDYDMVIWKYDRTGTLDSTFGTNGVVVSDGAAGVTNGTEDGWGIALDGSGNIYVIGNGTNSAGDADMVIWKYDDTGTLDSTFGTNGVVVSDGAAGGTNANDGGRDIALDGSGNIYVTGYGMNSGGDADMVIWKYDSTGTLDSTFGIGGIVVSDESAGNTDYGWGIALDGSGNLYVTGYSEVFGATTNYMVIWNYN